MFDLTKVTTRNTEQRKESKVEERLTKKVHKSKKHLLERTATMASERKWEDYVSFKWTMQYLMDNVPLFGPTKIVT